MQTWMSHVRRGLPKLLHLKTRFEREQLNLERLQYSENHKVVSTNLLKEERKAA